LREITASLRAHSWKGNYRANLYVMLYPTSIGENW
jgi:hypothetical protein